MCQVALLLGCTVGIVIVIVVVVGGIVVVVVVVVVATAIGVRVVEVGATCGSPGHMELRTGDWRGSTASLLHYWSVIDTVYLHPRCKTKVNNIISSTTLNQCDEGNLFCCNQCRGLIPDIVKH